MAPVKTYSRKPLKAKGISLDKKVQMKPKKKKKRGFSIKELPKPDYILSHDSIEVDINDTFDKLLLQTENDHRVNKNKENINITNNIHSPVIKTKPNKNNTNTLPQLKVNPLDISIDVSLSYYQKSMKIPEKSVTYDIVKMDSFNQLSVNNYSSMFNSSKVDNFSCVILNTPQNKINGALKVDRNKLVKLISSTPLKDSKIHRYDTRSHTKSFNMNNTSTNVPNQLSINMTQSNRNEHETKELSQYITKTKNRTKDNNTFNVTKESATTNSSHTSNREHKMNLPELEPYVRVTRARTRNLKKIAARTSIINNKNDKEDVKTSLSVTSTENNDVKTPELRKYVRRTKRTQNKGKKSERASIISSNNDTAESAASKIPELEHVRKTRGNIQKERKESQTNDSSDAHISSLVSIIDTEEACNAIYNTSNHERKKEDYITTNLSVTSTEDNVKSPELEKGVRRTKSTQNKGKESEKASIVSSNNDTSKSTASDTPKLEHVRKTRGNIQMERKESQTNDPSDAHISSLDTNIDTEEACNAIYNTSNQERKKEDYITTSLSVSSTEDNNGKESKRASIVSSNNDTAESTASETPELEHVRKTRRNIQMERKESKTNDSSDAHISSLVSNIDAEEACNAIYNTSNQERKEDYITTNLSVTSTEDNNGKESERASIHRKSNDTAKSAANNSPELEHVRKTRRNIQMDRKESKINDPSDAHISSLVSNIDTEEACNAIDNTSNQERKKEDYITTNLSVTSTEDNNGKESERASIHRKNNDTTKSAANNSPELEHVRKTRGNIQMERKESETNDPSDAQIFSLVSNIDTEEFCNAIYNISNQERKENYITPNLSVTSTENNDVKTPELEKYVQRTNKKTQNKGKQSKRTSIVSNNDTAEFVARKLSNKEIRVKSPELEQDVQKTRGNTPKDRKESKTYESLASLRFSSFVSNINAEEPCNNTSDISNQEINIKNSRPLIRKTVTDHNFHIINTRVSSNVFSNTEPQITSNSNENTELNQYLNNIQDIGNSSNVIDNNITQISQIDSYLVDISDQYERISIETKRNKDVKDDEKSSNIVDDIIDDLLNVHNTSSNLNEEIRLKMHINFDNNMSDSSNSDIVETSIFEERKLSSKCNSSCDPISNLNITDNSILDLTPTNSMFEESDHHNYSHDCLNKSNNSVVEKLSNENLHNRNEYDDKEFEESLECIEDLEQNQKRLTSLHITENSITHFTLSDSSLEESDHHNYSHDCLSKSNNVVVEKLSNEENRYVFGDMKIKAESLESIDTVEQSPKCIPSTSNLPKTADLTTPTKLHAGKWRRSLLMHRRNTVLNATGLNFTQTELGTIHENVNSRKTMRQTSFYPILNNKEKIFQICSQSAPIPFEKAFKEKFPNLVKKVGEGVYGEVFLNNRNNQEESVLKIMPIEGKLKVNGAIQKTFSEILSEILVARELSNLRTGSTNATNCFSELINVYCLQGQYVDELLQLWFEYDKLKTSENDCPEIFGKKQLYIVLEFSNGGIDLESFVFLNAGQALSAFKQIALALAVAEEALQFEHRDLHWGNVLIKKVEKNKTIDFYLNGRTITIPSNGVLICIIDFTLSRILYENNIIYTDLSNDEELFEGTGDYQFDIYRKMRSITKDNWNDFTPYTNIVWMHYVLNKMTKEVNYKNNKTNVHKQNLKEIKCLESLILDFKCAKDFVHDILIS